MTEIVYYARREAHFESFPAENYVDYMTNVMPIQERHIFYIPSKDMGIVCEVSMSGGNRVLLWRAERLDEPPENAQPVEISEHRITSTLEDLVEDQASTTCPVCEKNLRRFLRFF
jgi:hypothetical protein